MHFDKKDIEIYLQGVWAAIDAEKYQFAPRHKNRELLTDYVIFRRDRTRYYKKFDTDGFFHCRTK